MVALEAGHVNCVKVLVERGAQAKESDTVGVTYIYMQTISHTCTLYKACRNAFSIHYLT